MERMPLDEPASTIEARAAQLLVTAERMTTSGHNRKEAFWGIFGVGGAYVTLFPTMEDRLALRELPARKELFSLLRMMPS